MAYEDYRINAQVRALFVRRNVDLTKVEYGATNGVVYIRGALRSFFFNEPGDLSQAKLNEASFAHKLEQALRKIPGVRDVVFQLDRVVKVGPRWKPR